MAVDTNVLLRFIVRDNEAQAALSDSFLERICSREDPCFINRHVLCEAVWVLARGYGYSREAIAEVVEKILSAESLLVEDTAEAWAALRTYRGSKADFADCLIAKVNRALGCEATVTFDCQAASLEGFVLLT